MNAATGTLDKEINKYLHLLNTRQKQTVLNVIKTFASDKKDWWDELGEQQTKAIEQAEAELAAGRGVPHEQVMKKYRKWL